MFQLIKLPLITESLVSDINFRFSGKRLPSDAGSKVTAVDLSTYFNSGLNHGIDSLNSNDLVNGWVRTGKRLFNLNTPSSDNLRAVVVSNRKENLKT